MTEAGQVDILLVDDTRTDAEMTMRALRRGGIRQALLWLEDGGQALDFLMRRGRYAGRGSGDPKCILLDVKMPKVDGFDVLRTMKEDERLRSIPVVMLTSSSEEADVADSYRLGANSFVVKPLDLSDYDRVVGALGDYWITLNRTPGG